MAAAAAAVRAAWAAGAAWAVAAKAKAVDCLSAAVAAAKREWGWAAAVVVARPAARVAEGDPIPGRSIRWCPHTVSQGDGTAQRSSQVGGSSRRYCRCSSEKTRSLHSDRRMRSDRRMPAAAETVGAAAGPLAAHNSSREGGQHRMLRRIRRSRRESRCDRPYGSMRCLGAATRRMVCRGRIGSKKFAAGALHRTESPLRPL